jgi:predicted membrane-bound mannosyltransferase
MSTPPVDSNRRLVTLGILVFTLIGLAARALLSWYKPFIGDEVGTWIYIAKDVRFLLTHFIDPWLSMPAFIAGVRVWSHLVGEEAFVLRLPVVLAGTLAIPYLAAIVRRLGGVQPGRGGRGRIYGRESQRP